MTELELKARAYDLIATMEACKLELGRVNEALAKAAAEKTTEKEES